MSAFWALFLELRTVKRTIAAQGLRSFLDGVERVDATVKDAFLVAPDFGLKVMLVLENHLQNFHEMVAETSREVSRLRAADRRFPAHRAENLL